MNEVKECVLLGGHVQRHMFLPYYRITLTIVSCSGAIAAHLVSLTIWNYVMLYLSIINVYFTNKCQIGCLDIIEQLQLYLVRNYIRRKNI